MLKKICLAMSLFCTPALANENAFNLSAPKALVDTGFFKHLLPRFSLKTGIRITLNEDAGAVAFGADGRPAFRQGDQIWHFQGSDAAPALRFEDWLFSDVGKGTIEGFKPGGTQLFSTDIVVAAVEDVFEITGDTVLGEKVSLGKCGRCHVVNEQNKMKAIGSTPSFALMRSFDDWEARFTAFYVLKPHAAFTQIEDVTAPFAENLPSPISPIELTLAEVEAIVAYVASIEPADLGAPIQIQ